MAKHSKQEVWDSARFIWENTDDISDRELIERLQDAFGDAAPKSTGTISKRRKKEDWQKNNLLDSNQEAKKEARKGGSTQKRKQNRSSDGLLPEKDNKVGKMEAVPILEAGKQAIEQISTSVVKTVEDKAILINSHRRNWRQLSQLHDSVTNLASEVLKAALTEPQWDMGDGLLTKEEAERIATMQEEEADELKKKMAVLNLMGGTLQALVFTSKAISEVELPLNGITPEDFTESDTARRQKNLEKLDGINEEQNALREEAQRKMKLRALAFEQEAEAFEEVESAHDGSNGLVDEDTEEVDYTDVSDIDV
ncbi:MULTISPECIES: hypothetical protein [unclassified Psychrobacter]|uniref:hypothetical protein n=1 Tax=unclassified Psychrobacter TaxID=196806 RepID=UPI0018F60479|nr:MULTISPECIES: hypothetical protein [unclassified Psychrobacter]